MWRCGAGIKAEPVDFLGLSRRSSCPETIETGQCGRGDFLLPSGCFFILALLRKEEVGSLLPLAVTVIPGTCAQVSLPGPITGQMLSVGISLLGGRYFRSQRPRIVRKADLCH